MFVMDLMFLPLYNGFCESKASKACIGNHNFLCMSCLNLDSTLKWSCSQIFHWKKKSNPLRACMNWLLAFVDGISLTSVWDAPEITWQVVIFFWPAFLYRFMGIQNPSDGRMSRPRKNVIEKRPHGIVTPNSHLFYKYILFLIEGFDDC